MRTHTERALVRFMQFPKWLCVCAYAWATERSPESERMRTRAATNRYFSVAAHNLWDLIKTFRSTTSSPRTPQERSSFAAASRRVCGLECVLCVCICAGVNVCGVCANSQRTQHSHTHTYASQMRGSFSKFFDVRTRGIEKSE